jgi:hypothetical protein
MSTKAIHEALKELERHASTDCNSSAHASEVVKMLDAGRAGVAALEADNAALLEALMSSLEVPISQDLRKYVSSKLEAETHPGAALLKELRTLRALAANLEAEVKDMRDKFHRASNQLALEQASRDSAVSSVAALQRRVAELEHDLALNEDGLREEHAKAEAAYARGLVDGATPPTPTGLLEAVATVLARHSSLKGTEPREFFEALRVRDESMDALRTAYESALRADQKRCCPRDKDGDGECPWHPKSGPLFEAMKARMQRLETFAEHFAGLVDAAVAHREWKAAGKRGMQVPFHGDFIGATPSILATLRRLARDAREALKP